jgi:transcriptional regulator with XRE-family HTH domain
MKNRQLKHVLAENVRVACHKFDINTVELCKRSGGSPAAIKMLMNADKQPTLETVEAVAEGLAIEPWILFMDRMTDDMIGEHRTPDLVRKFANCSPDLKDSIMEYVDKMAELNKFRKS